MTDLPEDAELDAEVVVVDEVEDEDGEVYTNFRP